jgi:hypothetical protein
MLQARLRAHAFEYSEPAQRDAALRSEPPREAAGVSATESEALAAGLRSDVAHWR